MLVYHGIALRCRRLLFDRYWTYASDSLQRGKRVKRLISYIIDFEYYPYTLISQIIYSRGYFSFRNFVSLTMGVLVKGAVLHTYKGVHSESKEIYRAEAHVYVDPTERYHPPYDCRMEYCFRTQRRSSDLKAERDMRGNITHTSTLQHIEIIFLLVLDYTRSLIMC